LNGVYLLAATLDGERLVERAGRICWRSEPDKSGKFVRGLIARGHESVIEHFCAVFYVEPNLLRELVDLTVTSPLLRLSYAPRIEGRLQGYLVSGNVRMFREAVGCKLGDMFIEWLATMAPNLFYDVLGTQDFTEQEYNNPWKPIKVSGNIEFWSYTTIQDFPSELTSVHSFATFKFSEVSRALTHQLVRHRMASYSQASQRYCKEDDFDFVTPPSINDADFGTRMDFRGCMEDIRDAYISLRNSDAKIKAEDARYVLPNACHTEIVVTMPVWSWKHFFGLRCDPHAQWEIRDVAERTRELLL